MHGLVCLKLKRSVTSSLRESSPIADTVNVRTCRRSGGSRSSSRLVLAAVAGAVVIVASVVMAARLFPKACVSKLLRSLPVICFPPG